jgi:hypothetical protein
MVKRLAWAAGIGCLAAGLIAARSATGAVTVAEAAEQRDRYTVAGESTIARTLRFEGNGERTLVIRLITGSIRVSGSDDATVDLQVRKEIRAASDAEAREAERDVVLDIADNAATVGAIAREPEGHVCGERNDTGRGWQWRARYQVRFDVTVRVPRGTRLALCTINSGEIQVDQTAGDFDVRSVNGRISMNGIRGSGDAETVNGPVAVTFSDAPRAASRFKTVNGSVTIAFPAGLSADLVLKTFNGGLFTDFDVQPLPQRVPTAVEQQGLRRVYRSNDFTRVRVGRGGPELTFETLNGDVRVVRTAP